MREHADRSHDRAVAPVLGQIVLFTVVVSIVFAVTATAIPVITEQQADVQHTQAEDAIAEINAALASAAGTDQTRTQTVAVPAGTVQVGGNATEITISDGTRTHNISAAPIQVATGDRRVVSEAGLVAAVPDNPEMAPRIKDVPREVRVGGATPTYQIHLFAINQSGPARQVTNGQASEIDVEIRPQNNTAVSEFAGADGVQLTITTESPAMWQRYLENHPAFESVAQSGGTVTGTVDSDATVQFTAHQFTIR